MGPGLWRPPIERSALDPSRKGRRQLTPEGRLDQPGARVRPADLADPAVLSEPQPGPPDTRVEPELVVQFYV